MINFVNLVSLLVSLKVSNSRSTRLLQNTDEVGGRSEASRLLDTISHRYDKRVRPFAETSSPVIVHMTIVLGILTEVRENQQVASFVISHVQKWHDPKLAWSPSEHGGLKQVVMPHSMVWVPKLFIYNSMDTKDMLTEDKFDVRVHHTGMVKVNSPQFVTSLCRINIDLFPFDTQFCAIALASPLLSVEEMDVNATQPPRDSYFSGNAEWKVMNVTVRQMRFMEEGEYRVEVHYILHLNRRPTYYITVIVVPTFLISALSILGIFSPGSNDGPRNEKVSLGLGSLLAMTVLLDIVAGAMPKSDSIPLLGYYIMVVILLCAIGVGVSMGMLSMSRNCIQTSRMPTTTYYRLLFMKPYKLIKKKSFSGIINEKPPTTVTPKFPDLIAIYNQIIEVSRAQKCYRERLEKSNWKAKVEQEWNRVFARVDFFLLFFFQIFNVLILVLFLRFGFIAVPPLPDDFSI